MKKLGVIGGMGPMATAYFMKMVTDLTQAGTDQEHIEMLIHSCPYIPDRSDYLLGKSDKNPVEPMIQVGKGLIEAGAEVLAVPCVAASSFYEEMSQAFSVPLLDIVSETVAHIEKKGFKRVGFLAADGTLANGLFVKSIQEAGVEVMLPEEEDQREVMHLIYNVVKAGRTSTIGTLRISGNLHRRGAETVVLGCTELSVLCSQQRLQSGHVDAMGLLAAAAVRQCGGNLKE